MEKFITIITGFDDLRFFLKKGEKIYTTYEETEEALRNNKEIIFTTSLIHMSFLLQKFNYRLFVLKNGIAKEIYPGMKLKSGKKIKETDNILMMFVSHYFDDEFVEEKDDENVNS